MANPVEAVRPNTIATSKPRHRALTPTLRLALKFRLLVGVRKSEFIDAA